MLAGNGESLLWGIVPRGGIESPKRAGRLVSGV